MTLRRAAHTATLLDDGRVLIAGGCTAEGCEPGSGASSTELFDPTAGTFRPSPRMNGDRAGGHTAVRLRDGRVLLTGGWRGRPTAQAEVFDPRTQRFVAEAVMRTPRADASATLLPDGWVLVAGGGDGAQVLATAELFDSGQRRLRPHRLDGRTPAGPRGRAAGRRPGPIDRGQQAVALLSNGEVLVAGDGTQAEAYRPAQQAFRLVEGDLGAGRMFTTATTLANGDVLIAGGYDSRISPTDRAFIYRPAP